MAKSVVISLFATNLPVCPIAALRAMQSQRPAAARKSGVLFADDTSKQINKTGVLVPLLKLAIVALQKRTHAGLNADHFTGHSLRQGGATSLAAAGVSARLIQAIGRWKSDCYLRYIATPLDQLRASAQAMARVYASVSSDAIAAEVGKHSGLLESVGADSLEEMD